MVAGPVGLILGGLAGAIMDALGGGAAGCAVGEHIDAHVLGNFECHACAIQQHELQMKKKALRALASA